MQADANRPLNERGKKDAPRMGKRLKEKRVVPDLIISSPAKRALDTCTVIAEILNYPAALVKTYPELYHASEEIILDIIKSLDDKHDVVLIFGHNPGLTDFVNRLMNILIDNVPTCGVVACALNVDSWKEADWRKGKLLFFDFPKSKNN